MVRVLMCLLCLIVSTGAFVALDPQSQCSPPAMLLDGANRPAAHPAIVVSFESSTPKGLRNRDSVTAGLRRLGVAYDSVDRTSYGSTIIDYSPWAYLIWSTGDPAQGLSSSTGVGIGALSLKETQEITNFLKMGKPKYERAFVIAGQNIAYYNDFVTVNKRVTDTAFMHQMLHVQFVAVSPSPAAYANYIQGHIPVYFSFRDSLSASSPNVVARTLITPNVAPEVTGVPYVYNFHPSTPSDSGAGVAYEGPNFATIFFALDWADLTQTDNSENGLLSSGTTRALRGALDFLQSSGTFAVVDQPLLAKNDFVLEQNYPNPFDRSTSIDFTIPISSRTTIELLDMGGMSVRTIVHDQWMSEGRHRVIVDAADLPASDYLCRLSAYDEAGNTITRSRMMTVIR